MITFKEWKERALLAEAELEKCEKTIEKLRDELYESEEFGRIEADEIHWAIPFPTFLKSEHMAEFEQANEKRRNEIANKKPDNREDDYSEEASS